jgi:hypothetical protein
VPEHPADPEIVISVACRGRNPGEYEGITAQIRMPKLGRQRALDLVRHGLRQYGGTRFVGVTASGMANGGSGLDVTVCFPHRFPFIAHNVVAVPNLMLVQQAEVYSEVLAALGVSHMAFHSTFKVQRMQLRSLPEPRDLVDAFGRALRACRTVSLYAAELPLRQSMRAEQRRGRGGAFELTLSRGLSLAAPCTLRDCDEIGDFLEQHCDVRVAEVEWHVAARLWPGEPSPARTASRDVSR